MHIGAIFICSIMFLGANASDNQNLPETITSKIQGQDSEYVAIQIWSPFCWPCGEEVQELNKALNNASGISGKKLSVLGIPIQSRKKEINAFIEHFKPHYQQLSDDLSFEGFFKTSAVPWTILFSRKEGVKVKEWRGKIKAVELLAEIERLDINKRGTP